MSELTLTPETTALVLIDLQHGIVSRKTAPYDTATVVKHCAKLAALFREKGACVVYVHVDLANMLKFPADKSMRDPHAPPPPANASEIVAEAGMQKGDLAILKNQWGAFFGTDLEQQLRRRGITTIVLGGIATNYGVESTARAATGLGFELITVEDACTTMKAEDHRFAFESIFPYIGRVRSTEQILAALL